MSLLIQLDFETTSIFEHYVKLFQTTLYRADSDQQRLNLTALYLKKVCQVPVGFETMPITPRLKILLTEWLLNEMQYLERQVSVSRSDVVQPRAEGNFKLILDLSVAQLAFIARALVESGVIQNKNTTEMMVFLSKFINTKRSGSVSPESLRIKYYDVESATRDSVRSILHNAIGFINRS